MRAVFRAIAESGESREFDTYSQCIAWLSTVQLYSGCGYSTDSVDGAIIVRVRPYVSGTFARRFH